MTVRRCTGTIAASTLAPNGCLARDLATVHHHVTQGTNGQVGDNVGGTGAALSLQRIDRQATRFECILSCNRVVDVDLAGPFQSSLEVGNTDGQAAIQGSFVRDVDATALDFRMLVLIGLGRVTLG